MNSMREVQIEKVTVNMGVGQTGEELEKAIIIMEKITGAKPVKTESHVRQPTWGLRPGLTIGAKVTMRKSKAEEFLKNALQAKDNTINEKSFDKNGNFGFGIREYIDIPDMEYDPKIGVLGFDVSVTLERPGYRVKRKRLPRKLGKMHVIKKEDAIEFAKERFGIKIEE